VLGGCPFARLPRPGLACTAWELAALVGEEGFGPVGALALFGGALLGGAGKCPEVGELVAVLAAQLVAVLAAQLVAVLAAQLVAFGPGQNLAMAIQNGVPLAPVREIRPNLDCIPGGPALYDLPATYISRMARGESLSGLRGGLTRSGPMGQRRTATTILFSSTLRPVNRFCKLLRATTCPAATLLASPVTSRGSGTCGFWRSSQHEVSDQSALPSGVGRSPGLSVE